jgi:hypothetical protein
MTCEMPNLEAAFGPRIAAKPSSLLDDLPLLALREWWSSIAWHRRPPPFLKIPSQLVSVWGVAVLWCRRADGHKSPPRLEGSAVEEGTQFELATSLEDVLLGVARSLPLVCHLET